MSTTVFVGKLWRSCVDRDCKKISIGQKRKLCSVKCLHVSFLYFLALKTIEPMNKIILTSNIIIFKQTLREFWKIKTTKDEHKTILWIDSLTPFNHKNFKFES